MPHPWAKQFFHSKITIMKKFFQAEFSSLFRTACIFLLGLLIFFGGCKKVNERRALKDFQQVNLVDNNGKFGATHTVGSMMNAWGLAFAPVGIAWVNANGGGVSEVFDRDGNVVRPAVNIPSPTDPTGGTPTGVVFNFSKGFVLSNGQPAAFLFVGEDGVLSGWNGAAGNNAIRINAEPSTAEYKGLTMAINGMDTLLYAANFKAAKIDVWDKNFNPVSLPFMDPNLPSGYAPFNVQSISSWIVVNYAKIGTGGDEEDGVGKGFVDVYNPNGSLVTRFASRGLLNAPWGVAQAPPGFFEDNDGDKDDNNSQGNDNSQGDNSKIKHDPTQPTILVGNFGDGKINAFSLDGEFLGQLRAHGQTIAIEGLWALMFPPSTSTIDPNRLYFTAGPDDEKNGLFGYLIKE
jgi:uncharacterized protein (TIGR03118 family)